LAEQQELNARLKRTAAALRAAPSSAQLFMPSS